MKIRYHRKHLKNEVSFTMSFAGMGVLLVLSSLVFDFDFLHTGYSFVLSSILIFLWVKLKKHYGYIVLHGNTLSKQWWAFDSKIDLDKVSKISQYYDEITIYQGEKCMIIYSKKANKNDLNELMKVLKSLKVKFTNKTNS